MSKLCMRDPAQQMRRYFTETRFSVQAPVFLIRNWKSPSHPESWCFLLCIWIVLWLLLTSALSTETPRFLYHEVCIIFRLPSRFFFVSVLSSSLLPQKFTPFFFLSLSPFGSHSDKVPVSLPLLLFLLKHKEMKHSPDVLWSHPLLTLERSFVPQRSDSLIYGFLAPPQFLSYNTSRNAQIPTLAWNLDSMSI